MAVLLSVSKRHKNVTWIGADVREALLTHEVHEGDNEEERAAKIDEMRKVAEKLLDTDGK